MQEYKVQIGGLEHTLLLSDEDAKARGLTRESATKEAAAPKNKARTAAPTKD